MRRSAAPSFRADVKRARFLPQIIKNISFTDKENQDHSRSLVNTSAIREIGSSTNVSRPVQDTADENKIGAEKIRSDEDVLDLFFEADSSTVENTSNNNNITSANAKSNIDNSVNYFKTSRNLKPLKRNSLTALSQSETNEESYKSLSNCIFCTKDIEEASLFNVVWCKRSGKKHKTWEGDGLLIVRSRSAVLKDLNGKTLDKGLGYKLKETESLEEGSKFFIGGKECEIQYKIADEECQSGKYCKCNSNVESPMKQPEKPVLKIHKPC